MGRRGSVSHLARPASCPAPPTSQPQHYGERVRLRRGRRSVFPAKPRPKLWAFISAPCHLATSLTCFPLLGHLLGFQTRLCFHFASLPFNFCPEFRPGLISAFRRSSIFIRYCDARPPALVVLSAEQLHTRLRVICGNDCVRTQTMGWEFNKIHMSRLAFDTCECFFSWYCSGLFAGQCICNLGLLQLLNFLHLSAATALKWH